MRPNSSHDAFHILLTEKLREAEPALAFGSPWFLTLDYTLAGAEALRSAARRGDGFTSSITCDMWTDVLLPFMSPDIPEEDLSRTYASLAGSHFFPVASTISVGDLIRPIAPYLQDPYLSAEDIAWILQHDHLQQVLKKAAAEGTEPDMNVLGRIVATLIDERKNAKLAEMETRFRELTTRFNATEDRLKGEHRKELDELETTHDQRLAEETSRWQRYFRRADFVNDVVVSLALASVFGILAYWLWSAVGQIGAVLALVVIGFAAEGAALGTLRYYRALLRSELK